MARTPRKYVPKVKGERRINCDRGVPECAKCVSKGIRLENPKRSHLVHHRQSLFQKSGDADLPDDGGGEDRDISQIHLEPATAIGEARRDNQRQPYLWLDKDITIRHLEPCRSMATPSTQTLQVTSTQSPATPSNDAAVSDHIAPEMVVIDDCNNGWRNLVLPLACADELVMSAVVAVSAFHLSERAAGQRIVDADVLYSRAICELQRRQDLQHYDVDARYHIVLAIVVMLLAMIVNGCSDFPIMFRMLQSALDMVGGENVMAAGGQVIADFSAQQIRKMRVYASPFLSLDEGVSAVTTQVQQSWAGQQLYQQTYPDQSQALGLISSLRDQAFQIYLHRASSAEDSLAASTHLISNFKQMLESFPEALPGEHVLIWPIFIAASESYITDHQQFFAHFLERQFLRSGFVNIRKALESLRRIWARDRTENWTALLPKQPVFVM
ncbi:hypothetical protein FZEAL_5362 [Fusarium zealandicum]|uniref:Zn(2)-C6 fungal-type domain-containing protein n=1 Tax=Fusarium zealandicum TaxID=1053134 RepID=A0A8H4UKE5_9HYPO|nr:hypothetical protein FZEAL_5362 [Fusarium zealandicum]